MKLLLIAGPWGSGTTAVAGLVERLGVAGFGPYFQSYDERTPNTYELLPFRELIRRYVTIPTLSYDPGRLAELEKDLLAFRHQIERQQFGAYDPAGGQPIFLKYPPSALVLPQLCRVFDTRMISIMRPLSQIEQTRLRRDWPPVFGKMGAIVLYRHLSKAAGARLCPNMRANYSEVIGAPLQFVRRVVEFASLHADAQQMERAAAFVKRGGSSAFAALAKNVSREPPV
jgi:hypothetical protein